MEGEQKGIVEGEQKGIVKGEQIKSLKVASKLLLKGTTIEEVMYLTELSKEQVLEVLDKLPKS